MWQLSFRVESHQANILDYFLTSVSAESISFKPIGRAEEPLPELTLLTAIFPESSSFSNVVSALQLIVPNPLIIKYNKLKDHDWHLKWKAEAKPISFNFGLTICPTWLKPATKSDVTIRLDPGQAFGTGSHETTRLCLENIFSLKKIKKNAMLDFGCGTGILGIAAHLTGFDKVYAIDTDPVALEIAINNVKINKISLKRIIIFPPREFDRCFFDLIVANISLNPLIEHKRNFAKWIKPDGLILISGILDRQVCALVEDYESHFKLVSKKRINEWYSVILRNK